MDFYNAVDTSMIVCDEMDIYNAVDTSMIVCEEMDFYNAVDTSMSFVVKWIATKLSILICHL